FFFQAEDGIRADLVTGVQTCALPISNGARLHSERDMGHVSEVFDQARLDRLPGTSAIGHVRYSTAGEVSIRECQPFLVACQHGRSEERRVGKGDRCGRVRLMWRYSRT